MSSAQRELSFEAVESTIASKYPETLTTASCREIWDSLVSGDRKIVGSFTLADRAYLVLSEAPWPRVPPLQRDVAVLESVLLGASCKATAFDLGLSVSTVSVSLKRVLARFSSDTAQQHITLGLVLLARAAHDRSVSPLSLTVGMNHDGVGCDIISARVTDISLVLPPAVNAVTQLRLQGRSLAEIAAARGTSVRTVANQLSFAFHRFGASGATDLVSRLAGRCLADPPGPVRRPRVLSSG
jgi:DNA-binding NarL/FixJ family response regulator